MITFSIIVGILAVIIGLCRVFTGYDVGLGLAYVFCGIIAVIYSASYKEDVIPEIDTVQNVSDKQDTVEEKHSVPNVIFVYDTVTVYDTITVSDTVYKEITIKEIETTDSINPIAKVVDSLLSYVDSMVINGKSIAMVYDEINSLIDAEIHADELVVVEEL